MENETVVGRDNKLEVIVKNSGLVGNRAKDILAQFSNYFEIAEEWEETAKTIKVTHADQTVQMQLAKEGRLFLKQKRIAVEKLRISLKEQPLREGQVVDGIAKTLKGLMAPIETYLEEQEKFVEIQAKKEAEQLRIEAEKRIMAERVAEEEKFQKERRAKIEAQQEALRIQQIENNRLQQEIREQDARMAQERADAKRKQDEIEAVQRNKLAKLEAENRAERDKVERKAKEEREKQEAQMKKEREAVEKKQREIEAEALKKHTCPECGHKF